MKILWVVNKCCGALQQQLYGTKSTGGLWLDATLEDAKRHTEDEIVVVNVMNTTETYDIVDGNIHYYTISGQPNEHYAYSSAASVAAWKRIIDTEKPDLIQFWGTEFPYALAVIAAAPTIPTVVFAQGVLDSIAKYYTAGLSDKELRAARSLRDVLTGTTIRQTKRQYTKRAKYEAAIVRHSKHVILENEWSLSYYKKMCADVTAHVCPISIAESFTQHTWNEDAMRPHTILCSAANYPLKGLHMLLKALRIVKKQYPDVKLLVPGTKLRRADSLKNRLKRNGYDKLIAERIAEYGLDGNVEYTGRLTADEMAQTMATVNCFAMCSAIENHSSTLKEAMTVGTPSVSSYVGGVPEYATNGHNALLYRFEDYEMLAQHILRLFEDTDLRAALSENARIDMRRQDDAASDYEKFQAIYRKICQ